MSGNKLKPQMTPEQQTMFKQAVAQKALEPVPYADYCAVTPEEADKLFESLKGKVDFEQPLPEKNKTQEAPERAKLNADDPATEAQLRAIRKGVDDGFLEGLPENLEELTVAEASEYVKEIHAMRPPEPATDAQYKEIDRLVKNGRIYPMKSETYSALSKSDASERIAIGRNNEKEGITVEGYDPDYVPKRNQPMDKEQQDEIDKLVAEGRLNPLSDRQKTSFTQGEAGKLIFIGRKRQEENTFASEFDHSREQETPEPEKKEPEKSPKEKEKKSKSSKKSPPKPRPYEDDIPF